MSFLIKDVYAATDSAVTLTNTTVPATTTASVGTSADVLSTVAPTEATGGDGMFSILMMLAMVVIFYFLLWRPQSKRAKEHRNLINNLQKDDEVVTSGGVLGKITLVDEKFLKINVSEGVEIQLQRAAISAVLPKGTIR